MLLPKTATTHQIRSAIANNNHERGQPELIRKQNRNKFLTNWLQVNNKVDS